jgi:predicted dehydrogenase
MATLKNLLMIGGGRMAQIRINFARQHKIFNILGVIDPLAATRDAISEMDLQAFTDLEECRSVLDKADGFWISSMTSTHGPWIKTLSDYNKPIFVEKPLTDTLEQTMACIDICGSKSIPLHTGWMRRSDPILVEFAKKVQGMDWNHMLFIDRDNPIPTNSQLLNCGSFIQDMSGHAINFLLLLTEGETPYKVLASATPVYQTGVVDHCELTFFYKTGTKTRTVKFDISRKSP